MKVLIFWKNLRTKHNPNGPYRLTGRLQELLLEHSLFEYNAILYQYSVGTRRGLNPAPT